MAMRNNNRDGDDDFTARVLAIDIEECRDLMMACMMSRLQTLGWEEHEARRVADKAIDRLVDAVPKRLERMARICGNAAANGASEKVLHMLAHAEFALGGVEIADDLHKSKIASMN